MSSDRYELLSTLPPGAGTRTRIAWQLGAAGFRRAVVLREIPSGVETSVPAPAQEGVLPLLDLVELDGRRWGVYEFLPGATFREVAAAHFSVDRLPSLGLIGRVLVDACRAIHRVHTFVDPLGLSAPQGHGGLSDASIFLGFDGIARVLDLGARRVGKMIAPELVRADAFDGRADVFSLGALLHHATTRFEKSYAATISRAPSPAELPPPSTVHPEATPALDAVVMRALMPAPASRFASAAQLATEIEMVLGPGLFTHEQVRVVLLPLFGDRLLGLKDLVDLKKRPPAPRASAPRPSAPPRKAGNALDLVAAMDVKLDGEAAEIQDSPTQSNFKTKEAPVVADFDPHATNPGQAAQPKPDFDPHATTPGRALQPSNGAEPPALRPSGPRIVVQTAEEKARARGQEKISTGEFEALQRPGLGEDPEQPTNVRRKAAQAAGTGASPEEEGEPAAWEDPKKKEPTWDVEPAPSALVPAHKSGRGLKVLLAALVLAGAGGAAVYVLRPDLVEQLKARLRPPPPSPTVEELPLEDVLAVEDGGGAEAVAPGTADAGEAAPAADGGDDEVEELGSLGPDSGVRDAGPGKKKPAPAQKKKKKKKHSR